VLYLAFVLQGTSFQELLRGALAATRDQLHGKSPWSPTGRAATWAAARLPPALNQLDSGQ